MAVCGLAWVFDWILLCILGSDRFAREIRGRQSLQLELSMMFTYPWEAKLLGVLHSCDLQTNKEISLLKMHKSSNGPFFQGANRYQ